jgi:hypothetical protein
VALVALSAFLLQPAKARAAVAAMTVTPSILDLMSRVSSSADLNTPALCERQVGGPVPET